MPREKVLSSSAYWFEKAQNELFRQFHYYMEREKINQTQLAERLGITKGRVSQILRGESNFTIKTLMDLALSINTIPKINYIPVEDEVKADELIRVKKHNLAVTDDLLIEKKTEIQSETEPIHFKPYFINKATRGYLDNDSRIIPANSRVTVSDISQKVA